MDARKVQEARQRLTSEYEMLIQTINRNRLAAEEIKMENTEDEGDLAIISHNRHLLSNLDQSALFRTKLIKEALDALDRGQYGECIHCSNDIGEKRLSAVPWATLCIRCQEQTEAERLSSDTGTAGQEEEMDYV